MLFRSIADLIAGAGFRLARLENYYFHRPRAVGYTYEGVATKPWATDPTAAASEPLATGATGTAGGL